MIILEMLTTILVVVTTYVVLYAFYYIFSVYYDYCIKVERNKSDNINLKSFVNRKRVMQCRFTAGAYALTAFWIVVFLTNIQYLTR